MRELTLPQLIDRRDNLRETVGVPVYISDRGWHQKRLIKRYRNLCVIIYRKSIKSIQKLK